PAAPVPAPPIDIEVFGRTDVGLVREHNEDNFLVADLTLGHRSLMPEVRRHCLGPSGSLFVVCDGMGGAAAGEVASQIALDTVHGLLQGEPMAGVADLPRRLERAVVEAGRRIFHEARRDSARSGMGTTLSAAALLDRTLYLAQVGDSRG